VDARKFHSGIGTKGRFAYTRISDCLTNSIGKTGQCCLTQEIMRGKRIKDIVATSLPAF